MESGPSHIFTTKAITMITDSLGKVNVGYLYEKMESSSLE